MLDDSAVKYIWKHLATTSNDSFEYFHLLYKLHKNPIKTRPVYSNYDSMTHALLANGSTKCYSPLSKVNIRTSRTLRNWNKSSTSSTSCQMLAYLRTMQLVCKPISIQKTVLQFLNRFCLIQSHILSLSNTPREPLSKLSRSSYVTIACTLVISLQSNWMILPWGCRLLQQLLICWSPATK